MRPQSCRRIYELTGRRLCALSLRAARSVPGNTCFANYAPIEGAQNIFQVNPSRRNVYGRNKTNRDHCQTIRKQRKPRSQRTEAAAAPSPSGNPGQLPEASNGFCSLRPRKVGRGCPVMMMRQMLLLRLFPHLPSLPDFLVMVSMCSVASAVVPS